MMRYILTILPISFLLMGCELQPLSKPEAADATVSAPTSTFVGGTLDQEQWQGDGIALYEGDTINLIQGAWGNAESIFELEIHLQDIDSGRHPLGTAETFAVVYQRDLQDTYKYTYIPTGQETDRLTFEWNKDARTISGEFEFFAIGHGYSFPIRGYFNNIDVRASTTPWTCNFESNPISDCWFVE